ncbi:MAG: phosphopantetheine-binding protein [Casimicrobiaceae bacterium]
MIATFEKVKAMMVAKLRLDPDTVQPSTQLADLDVDSLSAMEFVFELEETFDVSLEGKFDLRSSTIQSIIDATNMALSQQGSSTATP